MNIPILSLQVSNITCYLLVQMRVKLQEQPIQARPVKSLPAPAHPSETSKSIEKTEKIDALSKKLGLTPKQKLAADYYLQNFNKYKAAIKAGYSESVANCAEDNIFSVPAVRDYINQKINRRFRKEEFSAEQVLMQIENAASANLLDYGNVTEDGGFELDLTKVDRYLAANIQEYYIDAAGKPKIKLIDKKWALEKKAQLLKMFETSQGPGAESEPLTIQSLDAIVQKVVTNNTINQNITVNVGAREAQQFSQILEGSDDSLSNS